MKLWLDYIAMMRLSPADKRSINKRNWKATNEQRLALLDKEDGWDYRRPKRLSSNTSKSLREYTEGARCGTRG